MKPEYTEEFFGITFKAKRGDTLEIRADTRDYFVSFSDGILNILSRTGMDGRTAAFADDCDFFTVHGELILIRVFPGSASYMKELQKLRPLKQLEIEQHNLMRIR